MTLTPQVQVTLRAQNAMDYAYFLELQYPGFRPDTKETW